MHILPRTASDFEPQDAIYEVLDSEGAANATPGQMRQNKSNNKLKMDADRKPRSEDDMEQEAQWLATFFQDQTAP